MATVTEREASQRKNNTEAAVSPLLARANLYRIRGQWNEAIAVCTEALRVAPQSPTAHSLLGDIYESQGKLDDAIQWFGMAVDLNPANAPDRAKLERVLAAKRAVMEAQSRKQASSPATLVAAAPPKEKTLDRTIEWFDRAFPPGRSDSIVRLILLVGVTIASVIALSAAFVYFNIRRENNAAVLPDALAVSTSASPLRPAVPTIVIETPPRARPQETTGTIITAPNTAPKAGEGKDGEAVSSMSRTDDPRRLSEAIQSNLGSVVSVRGAQSTGGTVQVSLQLETHVIDETPMRTRERVVRAAATAAHAAAQADMAAQKCDITVALMSGVLAFRGTASASSIRQYAPAYLASASQTSLFSEVQWGVGLAPDASGNGPTR